MKRNFLLILFTLFFFTAYAQNGSALEVDKMPEYPGGESKMLEYLSRLKTPINITKAENIFTSLVIDSTGKVTEVRIINKSVNQALNDSIVKHIEEMPRWVPGENDGKKVAVRFVIPYDIKLPDAKYKLDKKTGEKVYTFLGLDRKPIFPGGDQKQIEYMSKLPAPPNLKKEAFYVIFFVIDTSGKVTDIRLKNESENEALNDSVRKHIENMPKWTPGLVNGVRVRSEMMISHRVEVSEKKQEETEKPEIFTITEKMPEFLGGEDALLTYLASAKCNYDLKQDAVIYVKFVIDTVGKVTNVRLAKKSDLYGLNFCVLDHIRDMPRWTPGMQNGKNVMVQYVVPVKFRANTKKRRKQKKR